LAEAVEREEYLIERYKELDIFKLDQIARELKDVLKKVEVTEQHTKQLKNDARQFKDYHDKRRTEVDGDVIIDDCRQTEAHINDVILKCFNEMQRRHIGVATDNENRAKSRRDGRVLDGGSMFYKVDEDDEGDACQLPAEDMVCTVASRIWSASSPRGIPQMNFRFCRGTSPTRKLNLAERNDSRQSASGTSSSKPSPRPSPATVHRVLDLKPSPRPSPATVHRVLDLKPSPKPSPQIKHRVLESPQTKHRVLEPTPKGSLPTPKGSSTPKPNSPGSSPQTRFRIIEPTDYGSSKAAPLY
jgi:hypothetical protein